MEIEETLDEARYINHAVTAQILRSDSPSHIKKNAAEVIASQKFQYFRQKLPEANLIRQPD